MHPVLKVAGVVHIWYYIPLCTIFAQQFYGDVFRTQFHLAKSRSRNPTPIFEAGLLNSSVWQSMGVIRRLFNDPNHLALQELGWQFHSGLFQGAFSEVINYFNQLSRHQVFNTPWTAQLVHTGVNQSTCMYLAQLGQFIFHFGSSVTQFKIQDGQNCIDPIQTI
ncbi:hypothetical protein O181_115749 [Austropuccinia psidii MF-1]|uniref:Uncharacterized protein n=1 Tax=Austropuccinia psidii MF-1 TaxID=1389203 RepID=A0A9Q3PVW4_9BASI|nr:hypothetical protein [Austropuccinia psidii MF-1]